MYCWSVLVIESILLSLGYGLQSCQYYLSRRVEGVFHYDRNSRYRLTYQDAEAACQQDFRATLANRDQLLEALKSGLEECRAGWISLAEVAYPRIHPHWNCGENKTGIISYGLRQNLQEKWDVFCYKQDDDCSPYVRAYGNLHSVETQISNNLQKKSSSSQVTASITTGNGLNPTSKFQPLILPNLYFTTMVTSMEKEITHIGYAQQPSSPRVKIMTTTDASPLRRYEKLEPVTAQENMSAATNLDIFSVALNSKEGQTAISMNKEGIGFKHSKAETHQYIPTMKMFPSSIRQRNLINGKPANASETSFYGNQQLLKASYIERRKISERISSTPVTSKSSFVSQTLLTLGIVHINHSTNGNKNAVLIKKNPGLTVLENSSFVTEQIKISTLSSVQDSTTGPNGHISKERVTMLLMSPPTTATPEYSTLSTKVHSLAKIFKFATIEPTIDETTKLQFPEKQPNFLLTTSTYSSPIKSLTDMYENNADLVASSKLQESVTTLENVLPSITWAHLDIVKTFKKEVQMMSENKSIGVAEHATLATPRDTHFPTVVSDVFPSANILPSLANYEIDGANQIYSKNREPQAGKPRPFDAIKEMLSFSSKVNSTLVTSVNGAAQQNLSILDQNKSLDTTDVIKNIPSVEPRQYNRLTAPQNIALTSVNLNDEVQFLGTSENRHVVPSDSTISSFQENYHIINLQGTEKTTQSSKFSNDSLIKHLKILKNVSVDSNPLVNGTLPPKMAVKDGVSSNGLLDKPDSQTSNLYVLASKAPVMTTASIHSHSTFGTDDELPSLSNSSIQSRISDNTLSLTGMINKPLDTCGGDIKGKTGQFQSPGFPQSYESDMNCTWILEAPLGYFIILNFKSLVLEEHRNCQYDYVLIYEGKESSSKELGRFCGSQLPPQIRATSNLMTVVMRSDSSVELDGILVQFHSIKYISDGIRLKDGINQFEGIVEVEYQGVRGSICAKQWNDKDAQVVCRQLGYSGPAIATRISVEDNSPVVISLVSCDGNEASLDNCSLKNSGTCGLKERAGVICQVVESCSVLKNAGVQESGSYTIDPDGVGQGESHFTVECDMVSDITTGITIVGHDTEGRERVSPCEDPGCYSRTVTYKHVSMDQLKALTAISDACEQFVRLECRHIRFLDGLWGWWVSRDGHQITSWGGATTNSGQCACGENGECALEGTSCNCDANDDVWRMDEGTLTDKSTLPVQEVRFGDTMDAPMEMAFHSIGKLRCWGIIPEPPILESCAALKEAGISDTGRYIIDPDGVGQGVTEFEVFCDMSSNTGITVISHDSERRMRVTPCEEAGCYRREVKYNSELVQLHALTMVSQKCEQFVRLDCRHIRFIQSGWGWWVSWDGKRMNYWGGANPAIGGCACGNTGTCSVPNKLCNCDSNDQIWRTDDGFLRDKDALPVQAVHFGDTNEFPLEMAYHTIGKLRCRGRDDISSAYYTYGWLRINPED